MSRTPLLEELEARVGAPSAARLIKYVQLLEQWAATHNLVRFGSREDLLNRHVLEPLALVERLGDQGRLLDVGSGAGLPGVPLLATMDRWRGVLLEPRQKRWAFLRLVVRELGLNAEVVDRRYQDFEGDGFDLITARALGGYDELMVWARGRLNPGGRLVLWLNEEDAERLQGLHEWRVLSSPLVGLDRGRLIFLEPCFT